MNNSRKPLPQKIKCPMCESEFIPESFHIENLDINRSLYVGEIYKSDEIDPKYKIRPPIIMNRAWVTYCPECLYTIRFAAQILRKELAEKVDHTATSSQFKESGVIYVYNPYTYNKPFMELTDYNIAYIEQLKTDIKNIFTKLKVEEWGALYSSWRNEKQIDSFKFLVRFITYLDNHHTYHYGANKEKKMPEKIRELNFPSELENLLLKVNGIRNNIVHGKISLQEKDEILINEAYFKLIFNLIAENLKSLNLDKLSIEDDKINIESEDLYSEIRAFLHNYLGELLGLKKFYKPFLIPLLKELKIPINGK
ncbi:MAG: hypothetical protein ACFFG0_54165 [Candidatus Thorarchaeota archaeon]